MSIANKQSLLLSWFDKNRRAMPWRAARRAKANPYHVWLSEIMLQQTTVAAVGPYFLKFIGKWPSVGALAAASLDEVLAAWAGLGYYARARNLHKCAQAVVKAGGFPSSARALMDLPGIGPYTAAAISSIAFNHPEVAVDGNVERVVSRFFAIRKPLPFSKPEIRKKAEELAGGNPRPGDFTQAFMELGATVCTPRAPKCLQCPWKKDCAARALGIAEQLPAKQAKPSKPVRYGRVYCIYNRKGDILIEKRKTKGLYEGLYQLPTTEWVEDKTAARLLRHPLDKTGVRTAGVTIRHSFTHFDLVLELWTGGGKGKGLWVSRHQLDDYALPSLMKKAIRMQASGGLEKTAD